MDELWQRYDEQGRPIVGVGATKEDATVKALLHAASHVWLWRRDKGITKVLLQKRSQDKLTWPGKLDVSAAGHVDIDEDPLVAALRETQEELGLMLAGEDLRLVGVVRISMPVSGTRLVENEFQWIYLAQAPEGVYNLEASEVESLEWKPLDELRHELADMSLADGYVPHGKAYFTMLLMAIEQVL